MPHLSRSTAAILHELHTCVRVCIADHTVAISSIVAWDIKHLDAGFKSLECRCFPRTIPSSSVGLAQSGLVMDQASANYA